MLIVLVILLSGCGFKLNRNQITLPDGARSISLQSIVNKSYTPGLDILLKELLIDGLSRNAVAIRSPQTADLSLLFQIDKAQYSRRDYALDNTTKSYEFVFTVSGKLTLVSNSKNTTIKSNLRLSGTYSLKTDATSLTQSEIVDGRLESVEDLSEQVLNSLKQSF